MKLLKKEKTLVTFLEIFVVVSVLVCEYCKALYLLISGDVNALERSAMTTVEPQCNKVPRDCQKEDSLYTSFIYYRLYLGIPWGPHSSFKRERKIRCCLFTYSIKGEIRDFHSVIVQ